MEFVAQLVERQIVALVVVGSIPIKLPNASIAHWQCSSLVMSRSYGGFAFCRRDFAKFKQASNSSILSLFSVWHVVTMPDRNNYANNDVKILQRMYLMYVHNNSVQSIDGSERMIVMLCAYLNSYPYRIFIFYFFICLIRLKILRNIFVQHDKCYKHAEFKNKGLYCL